jgi:hypothetical protein
MIAHAGRLRVKMAAVGWKEDGSSGVPAWIVNDLSLFITPQNTKLLQTGRFGSGPNTNHYTILDQLRLPDSVLTRAILQMAEYKTS